MKKVLIIRRDNIGDLVCTTPLFSALREALPNAYLAALVNSYNAEALHDNPVLDDVFVYTKAKHSERSKLRVWWDTWRLMRSLRARQFDLVLLLFGNSWLGSAPLLIWTALWMIISLPCHLIHSVLIAMGHAESLLKAELTMLSVKIVVVVLAAPMGIEAVAIALLLQSCIYVLVWSSRLRTAIGLNLFDLLRAQLNSAPPALACGIAAYFGREYCQHLALPPLPTVALCMTLGGLVWLASIWAVHHPLAAEILRLSRNVLDRYREIGTMLALGATRTQVGVKFAVETLIVGLVFGGIGVTIGALLALVISAIGIPMPPPPGTAHGFTAGISFSAGNALSALGLVGIACALACLPSVVRASRVQIVDALRK